MRKQKIRHDQFINKLLSDKNIAIDFCRELLPDKILRFIDLQSLRYSDKSFVDPKLRRHYSDLLLRFNRNEKNDSALYISLLLEHKSAIDQKIELQLLRYLVEAYIQQYKNERILELIIPVVYYHGEQKWKVKSLVDLIRDLPKELEIFVPKFDYA